MKRRNVTSILGICIMLVLILDSKTVLNGAYAGLVLCAQAVIPALFPFLFISLLLTNSLVGSRIPLMGPLCRLLKIPRGSECLFLNGILGGYPAGAQSIAFACKNGQLRNTDAERMLCFCNNAGPAFIFGIGMLLFDNVWICFLIWGIQIISALFVGIFCSNQNELEYIGIQDAPISVTTALKKSIESIILVSGWVILFRILLHLLERWCIWWLPKVAQVIISGVLELSNGSLALSGILPTGLRVCLFSAFLSLGGFCVSMQTFSVLSDSKIRGTMYMPSKITQSAIALMLSFGAQFLLPAEIRYFPPIYLPLLCAAICAIYLLMQKKQKISMAFSLIMMYDKEKRTR